MTTTGKVFRAYAEEITNRYGFGSNKMVAEGSPSFISLEIAKGQRLIDKYNWLNARTTVLLEDLEKAEAGKEEGLKIWGEIGAAETWLIENGYLRKYSWGFYTRYGRKSQNRSGISIGLTDKGWRIAQKYIDSPA